MGDGDLKRLLDAERKAERSVEEARQRSQRIIMKAEEDLEKSRKGRILEFEESASKKLEEARTLALEDSAKTRKDGAMMASDLRNSSKGRMEVAVSKVLETVKENL